MFIVELTYASIAEADATELEAHRRFLARQYEQEVFLASGPKNTSNGAVILVSGAVTRDELDGILALDPLVRRDMAQSRVTEFEPSTRHPVLNYVL